MPEIGLVLGGGGARGFAHIGALKALEENGLSPAGIAGCSMGGIVGALYAAGHTAATIHEFAKRVSLTQFLDFGKPGGVLGGSGVEKTLRDKLPDTFEQLSTPLMVTATDVQSGELVVLRSGPLVAALRASSALPGLISPTKLTGRTLIDGGVLNNLPVDIIQTMTLAPVVAVDVTPSADRSIDFGEDATLWERIASTWQSKQRPLVIEVLVKASEITQNVLTDLRLAMYPPKLYIRVPLDTNFKVEDFGRLNEAVEVGYRATLETLKEASW